ncbi:transcriptional regulator NrdR [Patescibacteria group bacterium]|nr:transcriptional regulator NrdR [Patescibacteria group bacterium]
MHCPSCNYYDTKVTDSRVVADGLNIRRRRECTKCNFRFSTVEESEILDLAVIKRDGSHEPYNKEKLSVGLRHSLEKRPYTADRFKGLVQKIERDIQRRRKPEITSRDIGEIVMKRLKNFDQVAYIRFASVYRSFQDVDSFTKELKGLNVRSAKRRLTDKK